MIRAAVLACCLPVLAFADGNRAVIPITQTELADHDIRYSVPVIIGDGPPVAALLDTGSTGLRVFRDSLAPASFTDTGLNSDYAYGSGEQLTGDIGTAPVTLGFETTDNPIPFEIVQNASCMNFQPNCGAMLESQDYGIGGDGIAGAGFRAIIGVSLLPATGDGYTQNPLAHLGSHRWIITLPEPGAQNPGALILNPDDDDLIGFQMYPLRMIPGPGDDNGWLDELAGCLNDISADQTVCGLTILDTGSPGILAYRQGADGGALWSAGDNVSLTLSSGGNAANSIAFTADGMPGTGLVQEPPAGPFALVAGVLPFFAYDVLYDAADGEIGLRPRADAPNLQTTEGQESSPDIEVIQMNAPNAKPATKPGGGMQLPQVITPGP